MTPRGCLPSCATSSSRTTGSRPSSRPDCVRLGSCPPCPSLPAQQSELTVPHPARRAVLGLWHPKYVEPAQRLLPAVRRAHIGMSPALARKYFWDACCTFSMSFASMVNSEGQVFRDECRKAGKEITVWCVCPPPPHCFL